MGYLFAMMSEYCIFFFLCIALVSECCLYFKIICMFSCQGTFIQTQTNKNAFRCRENEAEHGKAIGRRTQSRLGTDMAQQPAKPVHVGTVGLMKGHIGRTNK